MKLSTVIRLALRLCVVAVLVALCAGPGECQDPNLRPTFGSVTLQAGFAPDPYSVTVIAGGTKEITIRGVKMLVANAPDFKLYYTAGSLPLTFYVRSAADTTLLINLPNGTWIADDDSDGNLNPVLKQGRPLSGRYDIWIGTFNKGSPNATLYITELR